jgi:hypothetical protein
MFNQIVVQFLESLEHTASKRPNPGLSLGGEDS